MLLETRRTAISYSYLAHSYHDHCNPLGVSKIERLVEMFDLPPGRRVVDFGAGKGELATRVVETYRARVVAVDSSSEFCQEARRRGQARGVDDRLTVVEQDAFEYLRDYDGELCDVGICLGSTHALGGYQTAISALQSIVTPRGLILIGEGYWRKSPPQEFLDFLGGQEDDLGNHAWNVRQGVERGLVPLWAVTASECDGDEYEWLQVRAVEDHALERPGDPEARSMLRRSRGWRDAYMKWGRETLGFGAYLFRNG